MLSCGVLDRDKNSKVKKGHNSGKKKKKKRNFKLSPLIAWIALPIVNTYRYSKFKENIFSNTSNRDITKNGAVSGCQQQQ